MSRKRIQRVAELGSVLLMVMLMMGLTNRGFAQSSSLKLEDAIQIALNVHPNSTIAENNAEIASQKIRESKAAFLPSVAVNASHDYNLKLPTTIISAGSFSDEEIRLRMGSPISTNVSVQADLALFDKASVLNLTSSKTEKEVTDLKALKENEAIIYNTASAYYEALTYLEKHKLLTENEKQNQQLVEILKLRYEQGVAKKSEYDRARVNLNSVKAELKLNENRYNLALNRLKFAMGISLQDQITIDDSISFSIPAEVPKMVELETYALVDAQIDEKNLRLKELEVKEKQAAFLPSLSAYGKYGANALGSGYSDAFDTWMDFSSVGLKANIPLFSGFRKSSQVKQSRIAFENQQLINQVNAENYRLEYQNAGIELMGSYNNLLANKENLELSDEVLKATTVEYREGTADLTAYLDVQSSYKEAQSNYTTSLLDFLNAQLAFELANGTLITYITNL